jgi:hypothetical protein
MLVKNTGNKDLNGGIKVILSDRAMEMLSEQFWMQGPRRITDVFARAMKDGFVSTCTQNVLVEFGCVLIIGELNDSVFRVGTVLNLSNGIPKRVKEMLGHASPRQTSRGGHDFLEIRWFQRSTKDTC